jgi:MEDS: MEthanogen/methylotroph, DcmR Sensory domain
MHIAGSADHRHLVQFYDADPDALIRTVARFIEEGLERDEAAIVIATPEHVDGLLAALPASADPTRSRRLVVLDAQATLDRFMVDGNPDWELFEKTVGGALRSLRRANDDGAVRAYGEMVGLLWASGRPEAAVRLEHFWNVLLDEGNAKLFCGYPIDVFGSEFHGQRVHDILCTHSHVIDSGTVSTMEAALGRAVEEVLGAEALASRDAAERPAAAGWGVLPKIEASILWLREKQPAYADEILSRARSYYRACA